MYLCWVERGLAIGEKNVSGNHDIHYPARAAQGKVIGIAVHIYMFICLWT